MRANREARRIGTGRMGHDGVRYGAVSGGSRIGVQHLLAQSVRYAVSDSACVDEDSPVRQGSEQTAPMSNAERRMQCDRLPNSVDVAFGDAVPPEYGSSQVGASTSKRASPVARSPSPRSCMTVAAKSRSSS